MAQTKISLSIVIGLFIASLLLVWLTHGTGIIMNDASRNIYIPEQLTLPLQV